MSSYRRLAGACLHGSNSVPRVQEGLLKPSFGTLTLHSIVPEQVTGPVQTHGVKRETSSLSIKSSEEDRAPASGFRDIKINPDCKSVNVQCRVLWPSFWFGLFAFCHLKKVLFC